MITTVAMTAVLLPTQAAKPALTLTRTKTMEGVRAVELSSSPVDSRFIACLENNQVRIMDAAGKLASVTLVGHKQPAYAAAFSPDGKQVLTGDEQARIILWDAKTGKLIREFSRDKGHRRGIQSFSFSPDGKQFMSVGKDDVLLVWNLSGGHPVTRVNGEPTNFFGAQYAPTGAVFTGTQVEGMRVLAPKTLSTVAKLILPGGQGANGFAMNKAGTLGVTCGRDGIVTVYDLKKRTRLMGMKGHADYVTSAQFTPSGKFVASGSIDGKVIVWDVKSYKKVTEIDDRSYVGTPVAFTGDGRFLVSLNAFDTVEIHQVSPPQPAGK